MKKSYSSKDLRDDFTITIQFYRENGSAGMLLTTNDNRAAYDTVSMRLHGMELAESKQLENKDHEELQAFCKSYLESMGYYVR